MTSTLSYELKVTEDGLEASLTVPRETGGIDDPSEFLRVLVEDEGLLDVDEEVVRGLLEVARGGKKAGPEVIARGREPIDGDDARLEWLGEFFERFPLMRPDGSVDHFRRNKTSVAPHTVIAQWVPPTEGTPGRTVRGLRIDPMPGRPWRPKLHHTVAWADEEQTRLQTLIGGQVEYAKDRVSVSQIMKVNAVDFSSSSIDFDGAVDVTGDVLEGFGLKATGSVNVTGYVEAAPVSAGANLTVKKGIIGRNKISVNADADVEVGFARELQLICGGQLVSSGELMRVDGQVGGDVTADKNRLVGGTWTIGGSLYVAELGSESEVPTVISVGIDADLERKQAEQTEERVQLQAEIEKRTEQLAMLERKKVLSDKEDLARRKLKVYLDQLAQKDVDLASAERLLRRRIKMRRRYGMVWVDQGVYPGVKIWAGGRPQPLEVTTYIKGPVRIGYMPGRQKPAITHGRNKKFESQW